MNTSPVLTAHVAGAHPVRRTTEPFKAAPSLPEEHFWGLWPPVEAFEWWSAKANTDGTRGWEPHTRAALRAADVSKDIQAGRERGRQAEATASQREGCPGSEGFLKLHLRAW